jgi:hypothetical protein
MRGLPTATPVAYRSLMDVKRDILGGSCSHHMSLITHIIRYYCNSPVEYDVSYAEGKYNKKMFDTCIYKSNIHFHSSS